MKYTKEILEKVVAENTSLADVIKNLVPNKTSGSGGLYSYLHRRIKEWGISTSHFKRKEALPKVQKPLSEIFTVNSSYHRGSLKRVIIKRKLLENKCSICGLFSTWNNQPIVMVLDHINGVWNDNRLENLRFLCPNCNSQQPTFCKGSLLLVKVQREKKEKKQFVCAVCGKPKLSKTGDSCVACYLLSRRVTKRPSKEELLKLVWEIPCSILSKRFSVSDTSLKKWCRSYNIPKPPRGYWAKKAKASIQEQPKV